MLGSVLTAQSLEPASDSASLSAPAPLSSPSGSTLSSGYSFDISRWKPTLLSSDSSMVDVICWLPVVDEGSALSLLHTDFSLPSNVGSKKVPYLAELKLAVLH